jgi:hypothetical protein
MCWGLHRRGWVAFALALSLLLAPCSGLRAATVTGTIYSADGSLFTGTLLFRTLRTPLVSGSALVTGGDYRVSITNGALSTTLLAGDYRGFVGADQKGFILSVPTGSDSYSLLALITNAITYTDQVYPWQSAPLASASVSGRVRTDVTEADPVVLTVATAADTYLPAANGTAVALTGSLTNATANGIALTVAGISAVAATTAGDLQDLASNGILQSTAPARIRVLRDNDGRVLGSGRWYSKNLTDTRTSDGVTIILPIDIPSDATAGRWVLEGYEP